MLQAIIHFPNDFGWSKWCNVAMISDRRRKLSGKWLQQGTQSEQRGTPKFISYLLLVVIYLITSPFLDDFSHDIPIYQPL